MPYVKRFSLPLLVFILALASRSVYVWEAEHSDPTVTVLMPFQDMYQYDATAREYLKGDFNYEFRPTLNTSDFYPFFLALLYKASGGSRHFARMVQVLLSSLTAVVLYLAALRIMERPYAFLCGAAFALYGMSIFFCAFLLPATLILVLYSLMLLFMLEYKKTEKTGFLILAGLMLSPCIVARPNNAILAPFFLFWIAMQEWRPKRKALHIGLFVCAAAVMPAVWELKTLVLGIHRNSYFSIGLYNFLIGNTYDASGIHFFSPQAATKIFADSGGNYFRGLLEWARSVIEHPGQWLFAELRKVTTFWIGYEPSDNMNYDVSRNFSLLLRLPLLRFGAVSALALLGMLSALKEWRKHTLLYLVAAGSYVSVVCFIIIWRFRLVMVPLLILFGGIAIQNIAGLALSGRFRKAAQWTAAGLCLLVLTRAGNIYYLYSDSYINYFEWMAHHTVAVAYIADHRPDLGEQQLKKMLDMAPSFAQTYVTYAQLCDMQGRRDEALRMVDEGLKVAPTYPGLLVMKKYLTKKYARVD